MKLSSVIIVVKVSSWISSLRGVGVRGSHGEMICCVCMSDSSEIPNEIVLCDNCGQDWYSDNSESM